MLTTQMGLVKTLRKEHWIHVTGMKLYANFGQTEILQAKKSSLGAWYSDERWIVAILLEGQIYIRKKEGIYTNLEQEVTTFLNQICPKKMTGPIFPEAFSVSEADLALREKNPYDHTVGDPTPHIQPDPEILSIAAFI